MADTYHPQTLLFPTRGTDWSGSSVEAQVDPPSVTIESGFQPENREILAMYEHAPPGTVLTWPDDLKPQYRVPAAVTEPLFREAFPAQTLAP